MKPENRMTRPKTKNRVFLFTILFTCLTEDSSRNVSYRQTFHFLNASGIEISPYGVFQAGSRHPESKCL